MSSTDPNNFALGAPRHTPRVEVAGPDPIRQRPVANFSQPARATQTSVTTGHLLNSTRRGRRDGGSGMSGLGTPARPLSGLEAAQAGIISASGLGKKPEEDSSPTGNRGLTEDEAMAASDADEPNPVSTGNPATNPDHPLLTRVRAQLAPPNYFED